MALTLLRTCCLLLLALLVVLPSASPFAQPIGKRQKLKNAVQTVRQKVGGILGKNDSDTIRVEKNFPAQGKQFDLARQQPQPEEQEELLSAKYGAIESVEERAYQIVLDLGLVKETKDSR